ncbi:hypothetical protein BGZ76_005092, partial [Entomortierella beljakovae]
HWLAIDHGTFWDDQKTTVTAKKALSKTQTAIIGIVGKAGDLVPGTLDHIGGKPASELQVGESSSSSSSSLTFNSPPSVNASRESKHKRFRTAVASSTSASASPTSVTSTLPSIEILSPWHTLMVACVNKLRNHIPSGLDSLSFEGLDGLERIIFKISHDLLQRPHLTKADTKDLMVAMSGVLDLRTWDYDEAPELIMPALDACNDSITALNTQLQCFSNI